MSMVDFHRFLAPHRNRETGIFEISPSRRFLHDETKYDDQYQLSAFDVGPGQRLLDLLAEDGRPMEGPAVELGCGTGLLTAGLVASGKYRPLLITDPSTAFIDIVRRKLLLQGSIPDEVMLGILNGENLGSLPSGLFSLITMRSVLHHFNDVEGFFAEAARLLAPGGVLTFYEPCADGFILMGALASLLPVIAESAGSPLTKQQQHSIQLFLDTMIFYTRRDIDKSAGEDKHAFRFDLLSQLAHRNGLTLRFVPDETEGSFERSFLDYLKYCMSFDDELVATAARHLKPALKFIKAGAAGTIPPSIVGQFICEKLG